MNRSTAQDRLYAALLKLVDALFVGALFFCATSIVRTALSLISLSWNEAIASYSLWFHVLMSLGFTVFIWIALLMGMGVRR